MVKNKMRELRGETGLRQEDLAEKAEVSRQTIISIESGRYSPSLPLARKIARIFGLAIEDVFIFEEEKEKRGRQRQDRNILKKPG